MAWRWQTCNSNGTIDGSFNFKALANVTLNNVLVSTALNANVVGTLNPDLFEVTGPLDAGALKGDAADDSIFYTLDNSTIANSVINGNAGDDTIVIENSLEAPGAITNTRVSGGADNDVINIAAGVVLNAGPVVNGLQRAGVTGNDGDDSIVVEDSNGGFINGNSGNDTIDVGGDDSSVFTNSKVSGGQDDDEIFLLGGITNTLVQGNFGDDSIFISGTFSGTVNGNADDDEISAVFDENAVITNSVLRGGQGDDSIDLSDAVSTANTSLFGDLGDDTLVGGNGAETITGGVGADIMTGEEGADVFAGVTGDSLAATSALGATATFGNGVDWITDFSADDSILFNGISYTSTDLGTTIGRAALENGTYRIESVGSSPTLFVIDGTFTPPGEGTAGATFTDASGPVGDIEGFLLFEASSPLAAGQSIAATSVEALIVQLQTFVPPVLAG